MPLQPSQIGSSDPEPASRSESNHIHPFEQSLVQNDFDLIQYSTA